MNLRCAFVALLLFAIEYADVSGCYFERALHFVPVRRRKRIISEKSGGFNPPARADLKYVRGGQISCFRRNPFRFRDNGKDGLSYLGQQVVRYVPIKAEIEVSLGPDDLVVYET